MIATDQVDCVVVDPNLGHEDGLEIVRNLPSKIDVPIIIISGDRLNETDKVLGLELGATDYIAKPVAWREFLARVRVSLRQRSLRPPLKDHKVYKFGRWKLNLRNRELRLGEDEVIKLTAGEFNLLVALVRSPCRVLTREQLLTATRANNDEVYDRTIDVLILRLRRRLMVDGCSHRLIKTERGMGYFFDCEVEIQRH
jgi:DNA-binding response OmpR family regulator